MNVTVFGLGKLGLPLAAVAASQGYSVTGFDVNEALISELNSNHVRLPEPRVADLLSLHDVLYTSVAPSAMSGCDVVFVVVPTPSLEDGSFSPRYVTDAAVQIGQSLASADHYVLCVLVSTVMPGVTDSVFRATLERESGKRCGADFGVCYNPEFIALGSVVQDMLTPDFVLIGESDAHAGNMLSDFYGFCNRPIARMGFKEAEIAKLSVNCYVTIKISFANMLAEICDGHDADAHRVTSAIGLDSRIGNKYLRPGTAYGGPCFPRDCKAFKAMAKRVSSPASLADETDWINDRQAERIADQVMAGLERPGRVAVLGVSYKPGTPVVEKSASLRLIPHLRNRGCDIIAWDPLVTTAPEGLTMAERLADCVRSADAIVIMHTSDVFRQLPPHSASVVVDPWGTQCRKN